MKSEAHVPEITLTARMRRVLIVGAVLVGTSLVSLAVAFSRPSPPAESTAAGVTATDDSASSPGRRSSPDRASSPRPRRGACSASAAPHRRPPTGARPSRRALASTSASRLASALLSRGA